MIRKQNEVGTREFQRPKLQYLPHMRVVASSSIYPRMHVVLQTQLSEEVNRLQQLKQKIEEALAGGSTEIPKWLEDNEEFRVLVREVERDVSKTVCGANACFNVRRPPVRNG